MGLVEAKRMFILRFSVDRPGLAVGVGGDRTNPTIEVRGRKEADLIDIPDEFQGFVVNKAVVRAKAL